jgi:lipopolysaccharide export LptBFGC system permease protein LptF
MGRWVYEQGWERSLNGSAIESYRKFDVATFPQLSEAPGYFKKEIKQSSEMSYDELRRYIHDLEQSGFDVVRLRVQLQKKIAYPLITLVMAVLAIPSRFRPASARQSQELRPRLVLAWSIGRSMACSKRWAI